LRECGRECWSVGVLECWSVGVLGGWGLDTEERPALQSPVRLTTSPAPTPGCEASLECVREPPLSRGLVRGESSNPCAGFGMRGGRQRGWPSLPSLQDGSVLLPLQGQGSFNSPAPLATVWDAFDMAGGAEADAESSAGSRMRGWRLCRLATRLNSPACGTVTALSATISPPTTLAEACCEDQVWRRTPPGALAKCRSM
jgi:hypothetical protein